MFKKVVLLLLCSCLAVACSKTVKGPVTGKKYDVKVGGWSDMDEYKKAREEAVNKEEPEIKTQDCDIDDCKADVREGL